MKEEKTWTEIRQKTKKKTKNERLLRFACAARVREVHACACLCMHVCMCVACMPRAPGAPVRHVCASGVCVCARAGLAQSRAGNQRTVGARHFCMLD